MQPFIAGWYYVPVDRVMGSLGRIKAELTFIPRVQKGEPPAEPIFNFDEVTYPGYIGLPLDWGLRNFPQPDVVDLTSDGSPLQLVARKLPDPSHPRASPGQGMFIDALHQGVVDNCAVMAVAATGTGKTVCALSVAARLQVPTLVLVHLNRLAHQWLDEAKDKLGLTDDECGWVRQGECDYQKPFMVGLLHSVVRRDYPLPFYGSRGLVIWDEVHKTGARFFSQSLGLFPSAYKLALTATVGRRDRCQGLYTTYFGTGQVVASAPAVCLKVFPLEYVSHTPVYGKKHSSWIKALTKDRARNEVLVTQIHNMYVDGKHILAIGDDIAHLEALMRMCAQRGIPAEEMGQFTGQRTVVNEKAVTYGPLDSCVQIGETVVFWAYHKDTEKQDRLFKRYQVLTVSDVLADGTLICERNDEHKNKAVSQQVSPDECRQVIGSKPKRVAVTNDELDAVKAHSRIIFATYGMMKEGIDIPRLDAGIDVTPRSDAVQVIGRVRRPVPGKEFAVWVTVIDKISPPLMQYWRRRLREYASDTTVEVIYGH